MIAPQSSPMSADRSLEERLSQRKVARLTGVSRSTIAAIVSGKRPDYELLKACAKPTGRSPPARPCDVPVAAIGSTCPADSVASRAARREAA